MAIDINLNSYTLSRGETFIVDSNIWIYLYSPYSTHSHGYEKFISNAHTNKCKLFVNSQIISEYINVICKTAYRGYLRQNRLSAKKFIFKRDFQQTNDYKKIFQLACDSVKNDILSQSKILPIKLWHIRESLNNPHQMNDYNDLVYSKMLINNMKIVSHDKDFKNHPENIVWLHY
ncbi:type II toxin-antitoxin system VapC family toxin [Streptococcus sp. sy004]|uniref:type II toxin-antitoxin system VapC family toxin n=1 Tax=Streptococcus sp. sy004 TaxID=2600149 RepID=UPI0011B3D81E|nr:type II toxin-antitoxin system VapC family toxin [Streptococcus sp. sy004]TWT12042.1 type II toxin-antitoxin system VapC family toxin [Streptococcus sp. sy004]